MKDKYFSLRMSSEEYNTIKERAKEEQRTMGNYLIYHATKLSESRSKSLTQ